MSNFLHHEPCPNCGSKDNLGVWDDGHKWCFGCSYYVPPESFRLIGSFIRAKKTRSSVSLPEDARSSLGLVANLWLDRYYLSKQEIERNRFLWSPSGVTMEDGRVVSPLLIFPFFDSSGNCIFWQGRNFSSINKKPKYFSRGDKESIVNIYGHFPNKPALFLVEDVISAIKVSRFGHSLPLFGSTLSPERAKRIATQFKNIVLWLDPDKSVEVLRMKNELGHIFDKIGIIFSNKDPKDYFNDELAKYVDTYTS